MRRDGARRATAREGVDPARRRRGRSDLKTYHPQVVSATHDAQLVWYSQPADAEERGGFFGVSVGRWGVGGARGDRDARAIGRRETASIRMRGRTVHGDDRGAERRDDQESVASHSKLHPATRARRPAARGAGKVKRGEPPQPVALFAMRDRAPEGSRRAPRLCPCSTRAFWRTYARRCGARARHDGRCQHRAQARLFPSSTGMGNQSG